MKKIANQARPQFGISYDIMQKPLKIDDSKNDFFSNHIKPEKSLLQHEFNLNIPISPSGNEERLGIMSKNFRSNR